MDDATGDAVQPHQFGTLAAGNAAFFALQRSGIDDIGRKVWIGK